MTGEASGAAQGGVAAAVAHAPAVGSVGLHLDQPRRAGAASAGSESTARRARLQAMLEDVCKAKEADYDEFLTKLKKNGQWHVGVY